MLNKCILRQKTIATPLGEKSGVLPSGPRLINQTTPSDHIDNFH
jgi:hypothetical protein